MVRQASDVKQAFLWRKPKCFSFIVVFHFSLLYALCWVFIFSDLSSSSLLWAIVCSTMLDFKFQSSILKLVGVRESINSLFTTPLFFQANTVLLVAIWFTRVVKIQGAGASTRVFSPMLMTMLI